MGKLLIDTLQTRLLVLGRYLFLRHLPDDQPAARAPHANNQRSRQRGGGLQRLADVQHSAQVLNQ